MQEKQGREAVAIREQQEKEAHALLLEMVAGIQELQNTCSEFKKGSDDFKVGPGIVSEGMFKMAAAFKNCSDIVDRVIAVYKPFVTLDQNSRGMVYSYEAITRFGLPEELHFAQYLYYKLVEGEKDEYGEHTYLSDYDYDRYNSLLKELGIK